MSECELCWLCGFPSGKVRGQNSNLHIFFLGFLHSPLRARRGNEALAQDSDSDGPEEAGGTATPKELAELALSRYPHDLEGKRQ